MLYCFIMCRIKIKFSYYYYYYYYSYRLYRLKPMCIISCTIIGHSYLCCHNALQSLNNHSLNVLAQLHSISEYCIIITGFVKTWTRRVPLVEQELLTFPVHLSLPPVLNGVRVTRSLVVCVCFVDRCLSFFFWPLCCLFFFDIRILITPLVSSNSSLETRYHPRLNVAYRNNL
jgi:hypothetical protein